MMQNTPKNRIINLQQMQKTLEDFSSEINTRVMLHQKINCEECKFKSCDFQFDNLAVFRRTINQIIEIKSTIQTIHTDMRLADNYQTRRDSQNSTMKDL